MVKTGKQVPLIYNHGQKSWDNFAFVELFSIHTYPAPLPPHKERWTRLSRMFSEFQHCVGWGKGELQEKFEKDALFNEGAQKLPKILNTALLSQGFLFSIVVINLFKSLWSFLPLRDKQFSWNYVDHRRYLATIPNHQRNLWRIRNHLKKVKKNNKKIMTQIMMPWWELLTLTCATF